jgi:hypothetical protein
MVQGQIVTKRYWMISTPEKARVEEEDNISCLEWTSLFTSFFTSTALSDEPSTSATKPIVRTIISIEAFVEIEKGPGWIELKPQTYSWADFCKLEGAADALQ